MTTFNAAINNLRNRLRTQIGKTDICVRRCDLEMVLDEFPCIYKEIALGTVFQASEGGKQTNWIYVGSRKTKTGSTSLCFVQEGTGYKYQASEAKTLIRKFPKMKDYT